MVEFDHFAHFYKMSDEDVIQKLIAAGLDSCPGGGAEIFREPTRSMICAHKCDADRWLELSGKVHAAGLKTNATMLYGHIESIEDRVDHLLRLRAQQDRVTRLSMSYSAGFLSGEDAAGPFAGTVWRRFAEDDGSVATVARQLRSHQSLLGNAGKASGASCAALWRKRH